MAMSIWSFVLRLCLCAALVFNGAATAAASVHMAGMHGQMGPSGQAAAPEPVRVALADDEGLPCHTHEAPPQASDSAPGSVDEAPASPSPDCCKSGTCRCACLQHGTVAIPVVTITAATVEHVDSVRPMASSHPTPALPHLIRPPIS